MPRISNPHDSADLVNIRAKCPANLYSLLRGRATANGDSMNDTIVKVLEAELKPYETVAKSLDDIDAWYACTQHDPRRTLVIKGDLLDEMYERRFPRETKHAE